jgi:tetratricopeptide (TPR) repeat protein
MNQRAIRSALLLVALTTPLTAQRLKLPVGLKELEQRAQKDSTDAAAFYNVALGYWAEQRYDDAEKALHQALALDARVAPAYLALAYLPFARRPDLWREIDERRVPDEWRPRLEEADRNYRRAFLINPLVDQRIMGATFPKKSVYWSIDEDLSKTYDYFYQGIDDISTGRYDEAYIHFQRMINDLNGDRRPERVPLWILWYNGLAAAHLAKYDDAIWDFQTILNRLKAKELQRRDSLVRVPLEMNQYRFILGWTYEHAGRAEEETHMYQETLVNDVGLYTAHVELANLYEVGRSWPDAITERQRAVNANPDDPSLVLDLGVTLGKANRLQESAQALHQAMDANPRDPRAPYFLGIVEQSLNHRDDARAAFTRFLTLAPSRYDRQIADAKQRLAALQ